MINFEIMMILMNFYTMIESYRGANNQAFNSFIFFYHVYSFIIQCKQLNNININIPTEVRLHIF